MVASTDTATVKPPQLSRFSFRFPTHFLESRHGLHHLFLARPEVREQRGDVGEVLLRRQRMLEQLQQLVLQVLPHRADLRPGQGGRQV